MIEVLSHMLRLLAFFALIVSSSSSSLDGASRPLINDLAENESASRLTKVFETIQNDTALIKTTTILNEGVNIFYSFSDSPYTNLTHGQSIKQTIIDATEHFSVAKSHRDDAESYMSAATLSTTEQHRAKSFCGKVNATSPIALDDEDINWTIHLMQNKTIALQNALKSSQQVIFYAVVIDTDLERWDELTQMETLDQQQKGLSKDVTWAEFVSLKEIHGYHGALETVAQDQLVRGRWDNEALRQIKDLRSKVKGTRLFGDVMDSLKDVSGDLANRQYHLTMLDSLHPSPEKAQVTAQLACSISKSKEGKTAARKMQGVRRALGL